MAPEQRHLLRMRQKGSLPKQMPSRNENATDINFIEPMDALPSFNGDTAFPGDAPETAEALPMDLFVVDPTDAAADDSVERTEIRRDWSAAADSVAPTLLLLLTLFALFIPSPSSFSLLNLPFASFSLFTPSK